MHKRKIMKIKGASLVFALCLGLSTGAVVTGSRRTKARTVESSIGMPTLPANRAALS